MSFWSWLGVGVTSYFASSVVWLNMPWLVGSIPEMTAPYVAALLGPPVLLVWGKQAVPFYGLMSALVLGSELLARLHHRHDADSGFFLLWPAFGLLMWLASGWYSWAVHL